MGTSANAIAIPPGFEVEDQGTVAIPPGFEVEQAKPVPVAAKPPSLSAPGPVEPQAANPMRATMSARKPGFLEQITAPIREGAIGRAFGVSSETAEARREDPSNPLLRFEAALPPGSGNGAVRNAAKFASGLTTPQNLLIMAGTSGLGALESQVGKQTISKLISLGFSSQMLYDAARQAPAFAEAVGRGDWEAARGILTQTGLSAGMSALALKHGTAVETPKPEATATQTAPFQEPGAPYPAAPPMNRAQRRATAAVPENGTPDSVTRAQAEREAIIGKSPSQWTNSDIIAADELRAQGYTGADQDLTAPGPIEPQPAPATQPKPARGARAPKIPAGFEVEPPPVANPTAAQPTVPESPSTLQVQMTQLNQGKRNVVMFPKGTSVPQLPEGTPTHQDAFGNTYAYDPEKLSPAAIDAAVANNSLPQILGDARAGMGAPDKSQLQGEPIAVVSRTMDGTTVQATATDQANLQATIDAAKKVTPPGGKVSVEPAENEIAARQQASATPPPAPGQQAPEVAEPEAGVRPAIAPAGKPTEIFTSTNRRVNVAYDVREDADLTNSFQPGYPQEYQPRDTGRAGGRQRVEQRKADMTAPLMAESRMASDGAPIILPDGTVITRNHGTQALREIYAEGRPQAQAYKQWITEHAEEFGLDPAKVAAMDKPVLTRVITDPMTPQDVATFAQEANMSSTARMSDAEVAAALAKRMTGPLMDLFDPTEDGRPNPEFVRELVKDLPVEEQAVFQDKSGQISQTGARIIRNTVFAKAYPDVRALERMAESEKPSLKNLTAGMLSAAPRVAQFQELAERGERFDLGIGSEISDAAAVLNHLQREGTPVEHWLAQGDMFGRDPAVEKLVQIFAENRRSSRRIAEVLKEYNEVADATGSPKQESMFGPAEPPSKAEVLDAAYQRVKERWNPQKDLFGDRAEGAPGSGELAPRSDANPGPGEGRAAAPDEVAAAESRLAAARKVAPFPGRSSERGAVPAQALVDVAKGVDTLTGASAFVQRDVIPKAKLLLDGGKETIQSLVHMVAPRTGVPTKTLDQIYRMKGGRDAAQYLLQQRLDTWNSRVDKMSQPQMVDFIDRQKQGQPQADPELQGLSDFLRQADDSIYQQLKRYKPSVPYLENHYRVLWKEIPRGADELDMGQSGKVFQGGGGKRPLPGSKGMLKQHTLDTMSEGIDRGGVPFSYNPIRMFEASYADSMKFITAQRMWESFKQLGAREFVKNGERAPEGFVPLDDRIAKVYFPTDAGLVNKGEWYVEQDAGRVLNNFLSRDLIRENSFGRGLMAVKNATTAIELSLSPFHLVFEGNEAIGSQVGIGLRKIFNLGLRGDLGAAAEGTKDVLTSPASAVTTARLGSQAKRAFGNFDQFSKTPDGKNFLQRNPDAIEMVKDYFNSGGKLGMHEDYKIQAYNSFREELNSGNWPGAALRGVPMLNQMIMKPLFEQYIPNLKLGFFLKEYALAKQEYADRLASGQMTSTQLARQVVDSVENRFGEMNFDNLYWNRTMKTALQLAFRSVTWKLGNLREYTNAIAGQGKEIGRAVSQGQMPLLHPSMAWLLGMSLWTAVLGGTIHTLATGKPPQQLKDVVYPMIDGASGIRVSVPTYWRDMVHAAHSPSGYVKSSLSGEIGRIADAWQNKDFYGNEVRNADDPALRQAWDTARHLVPMPFSASSARQAAAQGGSTTARVAGYAGFTKAPRYIDQSPAQQLASEYSQEHREAGSRTAVQAAASQVRSGILSIMRAGRDPSEQIQTALRRGLITPKDVPQLRKIARTDQLSGQVQRLSVAEALNVYDQASADERQRMARVMRVKLVGARTKPQQWTPRAAQLSQQYFGIQPTRVPDLSAPGPIQ